MRVKKKKRLRGCQVVWCGSGDQNGSEWLVVLCPSDDQNRSGWRVVMGDGACHGIHDE